MKVTDELVDRLAQLSMLEFDSVEKAAVKADLERMLDFVKALDAVDTEGIEPLVHMSTEENVLRVDEVTEQLDVKQALKNAPEHDSLYFKVPRVVEDKDA